MADALLWAALLGVLGACVGSFVAALATRWTTDRSIVRGRSRCDRCDRPVRARDLVPLLSAWRLRGRCRDCGEPIAAIHWRVELVATWIGAAAGLVAAGPIGLAGAVFGWFLLALATLDLTAWWLPDRLTAPLAVLGLALGEGRLVDRAIGGAAGFGALWVVMVAYRRLRGREGLGGGDPKLLGAIGCWLGWAMLPAVLVVAGLAGIGWALVLRARGEAVAGDTPLPFGALMAGAGFAAWLAMLGWVT